MVIIVRVAIKKKAVSGTTVITEIEKDNVVNIVYERMDFLYSVTYHYEDAKGKKLIQMIR